MYVIDALPKQTFSVCLFAFHFLPLSLLGFYMLNSYTTDGYLLLSKNGNVFKDTGTLKQNI